MTKSQEYKNGWNLRLVDANAKLPRSCKKNEEFLNGFWDCNSAVMKEIAIGIRESRIATRPEAM
jgi:hypothetical protein